MGKTMTTFTRAEELRNDLDNLHFILRYNIGVLAELEQLGQTHSAKFKKAEAEVNVLKKNIRRVEAELEAEEQREYDEEIVDEYYYSDGMHW